ncbi:MAG: alpha/beta hydrolase [Pseudomonadota bacterium]
MQPLVHFAHGKESGPWGSKIIHLAAIARVNGCDVESLDYAGIDDPQVRADKLVAACAGESRPLILVGSSMGGWVVTAASNQVKPLGLFLLAPAFYLPGYPDVSPRCAAGNIEVVHGWRDEVIPFANSVRFGEGQGCVVHLVEDDHRLGGVLEMIGGYFEIFLRRMLRDGS